MKHTLRTARLLQLQKKLDGYQKKIKELESSYERSISVLSDIQDESGRQSPMSSNVSVYCGPLNFYFNTFYRYL